jgi:hypothetical protein
MSHIKYCVIFTLYQYYHMPTTLSSSQKGLLVVASLVCFHLLVVLSSLFGNFLKIIWTAASQSALKVLYLEKAGGPIRLSSGVVMLEIAL